MLRNFLLIALRNFKREQIYAVINVSGLAVALMCCIFIFLWVNDEVRFDRFHRDADRIFRVMENFNYSNGEIYTYEALPSPLAEKLQTEFAEVEEATHYSWEQRLLLSSGNKSIYQDGYYADSSFFRVFSFPILEGHPGQLLKDLNSIVVTKRFAEKYFPGENALGKVIRINNELDVRVTGVLDIPYNSSIWFDFVMPFELYQKRSGPILDWTKHVTYTYLKLREGVDANAFNAKIKNVQKATHAENEAVDTFLFALKDWRLFWQFKNGALTGGGRIFYVVIFSIAAFFILLAACVNFMNLATARATRRAKEVGVRKVAGATRSVLILQFLTESLILSFISLAVSLLAVRLLTPLFNELSGKELHLDYTDPYLLGALLLITLVTGFLAGSYPAFFLSSFRPASVLKGNPFSFQRGINLRKGLVLFQFTLSVVLIVGAYVVNDQVRYMLKKDLGFNKEDVLYFDPQPGSLKDIDAFKSELLQNPLIESVGQAYDNPLNIYNNDVAQWDGIPATETVTLQTTVVDPDYLKTLGFTLLKGRHFSRDLASDSASFIVNETCARQMGFENPIGQRLKIYQTEGKVIGVVSDFHHNDFYSTIDPLAFVLGKPDQNQMSIFVRFRHGEIMNAVDHLEKVYAKFEPVFPLETRFIDQDLAIRYRREMMTGRLSLCFMMIIIFISCLGLFGLTLYTTERRTREIGVRKVLGASARSLVLLLCKDFARPVIFSLLLGLPAAWYLMGQFLSQYQFHTELRVWSFTLTGTCVLLLAAVTVAYQSTKAALANPAETLRTE
ncbi:MAG: ABC transporter permease [Cyclobacteriaceae bacterium]|nr:ABC transporter permease [Cyclobacteriaceae bacterium]